MASISADRDQKMSGGRSNGMARWRVQRILPSTRRILRPLLGRPYRAVRDATDRVLVRSYYRPRYRWPHPLLVVIGPPRSGTQLVAQLLAAVPGYRWRLPTDSDRCTDRLDVCRELFDQLPRNGYTVLKLHTRPMPDNLALLERFQARAVVLFRDLRDICVSRYFVVLHHPRYRHHAYYNTVSQSEGLSHCLEVIRDEFVPWIRGWLPIVRRFSERFLEIRYEDLRPDPRARLARVLDFYGIRRSPRQIDRIARHVAATTQFDLAANIRDGTVTARKGLVGDWKNHFTEEHVRKFKEGCGDVLIELGYERDLNW